MAATRPATVDLPSLLSSLLCACCLSQWLSDAPLLASVAAKERHVYWNASNPIFKLAGENVFLVRKNDMLVLHCPSNGLEFYHLYWTQSPAATAACQAAHPQVFSLLECSSAGNSGIIQVTDFSPIPGAPTFDRTVYVFTPSTGDRSGLSQTEGGACATRNMRLAIDIGDPDSVTPATALSSSTATEKSTANRATSSAADAAITTTSSSTGGSGAGGGSSSSTKSKAAAPSSTTKQSLSPTPQDLANRAPINLIIAASSVLPSLRLTLTALAALLLAQRLLLVP